MCLQSLKKHRYIVTIQCMSSSVAKHVGVHVSFPPLGSSSVFIYPAVHRLISLFNIFALCQCLSNIIAFLQLFGQNVTEAITLNICFCLVCIFLPNFLILCQNVLVFFFLLHTLKQFSYDDNFLVNSSCNCNITIQDLYMHKTDLNIFPSVCAETINPDEDDEDTEPRVVHPKTDEQRCRLQEACRDILLFKTLDQV